MANDGGTLALHAQWMVDTLTALTYGGKKVFKTVELWRHQIKLAGSGAESFTRYAPFAFVGYMESGAGREGGNELRQVPGYGVLIGLESREDGVAMWGDGSYLGVSRVRDLVIAAFESKRPAFGGQATCDEFYYVGDSKAIDAPKRCALEMYFETSQMTPEAQ